MNEPLIDRIKKLVCRVFGHKVNNGHWVHDNHTHFVCSRCCRVISKPLDLKGGSDD